MAWAELAAMRRRAATRHAEKEPKPPPTELDLEHLVIDFGERPVTALAFSADGRRLALSGGEGMPGPVSVMVVDLADPEQVTRLQAHRMGVHGLAWSEAGTLASASHDDAALLWDVGHPEPHIVLQASDARVSRQAVAFVGSDLFVADGLTWGAADANLWRVGPGGKDVVATVLGELGFAAMSATPEQDGLWVAIDRLRRPGPPIELRRLGPDGELQWAFASIDGRVSDLVALPDDRVAVAGETGEGWVRILDAMGAPHAERIFADRVRRIARSPDGQHLAIVTHTLEVIATDTLASVAEFSLQDGDSPLSVAWSPEGGHLAVGTASQEVHIYPWES